MITHAAIEVQLASVRSENEQLKRENDGLRTNYDRLYNRVTVTTDAAETLKRQIEGAPSPEVVVAAGQGGPDEVDNIDIPDLERRTDELEREIRQLVDTYRDQQLRIATVPSGWPTEGYLTDGFGYRHNPFGGGGSESHEGQDIASAWGTPVKSTADGLIVYAAARAGYGNVVVIYHGNGITTRYGHLSQIGVEPGQRIRRGDEIGKVGSTGRSTGPHCHYEVRQNDVALDPAKFVR
jgi:murein DD-endopeptidase MepM/ murein hydrolase activator NlpD